MALSKENPSSSSQLERLMDLLIDLQIVNQRSADKEESPPSKQDAISQGEPLASQAVEECEDSQTNALPVLESELNHLIGLELNEEQPQETTMQSIVEANSLATDDSLSAVEALPNQLAQSPCQEEQQEESTNPLLGSEVDLNQPENLDTPPEQAFNQLLQSQWEKAQGKEFTSQSIASTDDKSLENSIELFERWQRLLLTQEVMDSRKAIANFKEKLETLEHQIYEPTELINLLLPLITQILSLK